MAVVKVTIERSETLWSKARVWQTLNAQTGENGYVDTELPQTQRMTLLEQSVAESDFDLKSVIRAINNL